MSSIDTLGSAIGAVDTTEPRAAAEELLRLSEAVLEKWVEARGDEPTTDTREGFRLLALHRQGAKGEPSFNACRETCREIAYYYNLVTLEPGHAEITHRALLMQMVSTHLHLFISGKLEVAGLGDFCCSAKPVRLGSEDPSSIR
ncbi:MAG: hypothetical protein V2I25_04805 [Woeseiaceae bacterium]|jgi:hypothetical protein|nr:hypothetical protein [Woeseiaceae bacterium]